MLIVLRIRGSRQSPFPRLKLGKVCDDMLLSRDSLALSVSVDGAPLGRVGFAMTRHRRPDTIVSGPEPRLTVNDGFKAEGALLCAANHHFSFGELRLRCISRTFTDSCKP